MADTEGISIGTIERAIGASRGVISKAIAKGTDIQAKWLELICEKFPQYSPLWLLTGEGNMLKQSFDDTATPPGISTEKLSEINIADSHRKFSQQDQRDILIERFVATIKEQAEEIGRLKLRIEQLEQEKNVYAASRQTTPRELSASPLDP